MSEINFLKTYFSKLRELLNKEEYFENLIQVKEILKKTHSDGKKL